MGREPDEVALRRGPEGLGFTSPRNDNHPPIPTGIRATRGYTAGRSRKSQDRAGRLGPGGPGPPRGLGSDNLDLGTGQAWSYKTSYRTANLAERIRTYDSELEQQYAII